MTTASAPPRRWPWVAAAIGLLALLGAGAYSVRFLVVIVIGNKGTQPPPEPPSALPPADPPDIAKQVRNFCGGSCHAYPPPETFPRRYWRAEVERGYRFFEKAGMAIKAPPTESVVRYYEQNAPEELPAATWDPPSRPLDVRFERVSYPGPPISGHFAVSNVNLVHLPEPGKLAPPDDKGPFDILACDMQHGLVMLLRPYEPKPAWKVLAHVPHPAHTQVIDLDGDGYRDILVANLGSFPPTDRRCGSVVWLRGRPDGSFTPVTLLDNVGRVADVRAAPFRKPGTLDLVVAVFGWLDTGELLFLENRTTDWNRPHFEPRRLDGRHGAIHVPVADLDGDGRPDFVALIAQEHETIVAFLNEGDGKFRTRMLYTARHPGYGSSGIQLVDLDGDGRRDILYTNGDTLDEPHLFKPYHQVRWLQNQGGLRFEHHALASMYGVHRAVAADVCGRGRQDIVAVSFLPADKFPERGKRNAAAIILLEQVAPGKFERHVLSAVDCDHVTCAAGDVYGTGRADIVVGNFSSRATDHPVTIWKNLGRRK